MINTVRMIVELEVDLSGTDSAGMFDFVEKTLIAARRELGASQSEKVSVTIDGRGYDFDPLNELCRIKSEQCPVWVHPGTQPRGKQCILPKDHAGDHKIDNELSKTLLDIARTGMKHD